jgi:transposase
VKGIATDLGIERTILRLWLDRLGSGTRTAADGTTTRGRRPAQAPRQETGEPGRTVDAAETTEQRLARLEAENAALRAEKATLVTEAQARGQSGSQGRAAQRAPA